MSSSLSSNLMSKGWNAIKGLFTSSSRALTAADIPGLAPGGFSDPLGMVASGML
jgi:hypothetical protein